MNPVWEDAGDIVPPMELREGSIRVGSFDFPYREAGPERGVPVLLLHGFPDCLHSWDSQLPALAEAGYRAIAPALRGYASTCLSPCGDYYLTSLVEDVVGLLEAFGFERAHLVGHDWGAVMGWLAIAAAPDRFLSFSSLAIPQLGGLGRAALRYPVQFRNSWYMYFFQLRGLSDRVLARNDFAFIERLWRDWSPGFAWPASTVNEVKATFRQPGVPRAALGYYRCAFDVLARKNREAQGLMRRNVPVPVLGLHGKNDGCMDYRLQGAAVMKEKLTSGIRIEVLDGVGHFLHQEAPGPVNALLLDFLAR